MEVPGEVARRVEVRLGPIARCFHFERSVGDVFGLELADGRRVAAKLHRPSVPGTRLRAQWRVQSRLAARGFPCPRPLAEPADRVTLEEWVDDGELATGRRPGERRLLAHALARQIELAMEAEPPPELAAPRQDGLWPEPHSPIFDFRSSAAGAGWIDAVAGRAAVGMRQGPLVVGHTDWSAKHFRIAEGAIRVVYDWDSVRLEREAVVAGFAAATFTARLDLPDPWRPRAEDALAFLAEYPRPVGAAAARAAAVYVVAYIARCEHALAWAGATGFVTDARAALPGFAAELGL